MSFNPASPVTGASVTGFTSPTYTITQDTAPNQNGKQYAVTALGGTQVGVDVNTVSKPFTMTFFRPPVLRPLPQANPVTGLVKDVPVNTYKLITRKGAKPAANLVDRVMKITTIIEVDAGCETYEAEDVKAMISAHFGLGYASASGIADTVISGVL